MQDWSFLVLSHSKDVVLALVVPGLVAPGLVVPGSVGVPFFYFTEIFGNICLKENITSTWFCLAQCTFILIKKKSPYP
jgi:hypothetical protein